MDRFRWLCPEAPSSDPKMLIAFHRFRRIAMTLRSHGKGSLARYRGKVEHQRVLKGVVGQALLSALLTDGVLSLRESFYHWNPTRAHELLQVSWLDLRRGATSSTLAAYLSAFVASHPKLFN